MPDRRSCQVLSMREVAGERQAGVGDQPAGAEVAQLRLALQRLDRAVAGRRTHQVDVLETVAESQVGDAGVGDAALPRHLESSQIRQVHAGPQAAIGELAAGILAEIELCSCGMRARCSSPSSVSCREPPRLSAGDVIELGDARQHVVGHQPAGVERGDAPLLASPRSARPIRCRSVRRRGAILLSVASIDERRHTRRRAG